MQADVQVREAIKNPRIAFSVQAPAGSGKTYALVQRFLSLLTNAVTEPEQIVALTFTRKAAQEMQHRILQALETDEKVAAKDLSMGWDLRNNPNRLRILTIDAFALEIAQHSPFASQLGTQWDLSMAPQRLYTLAVEAYFKAQWEAPEAGFVTLYRYFDHQLETLQSLLVALLAHRDQWAGLYRQGWQRDLAQSQRQAWDCFVADKILGLEQSLPSVMQIALEELWQMHIALVGPAANSLARWQALGALFLTKEGTWRKRAEFGAYKAVDPNSVLLKDFKKEWKILHQELGGITHLPPIWQAVLALPQQLYLEEAQPLWEALSSVLPTLVAHLLLVFKQVQALDFTEVTLRAQAVLGEAENPSWHLYQLQQQIHHVLVDEFQDSSLAHYTLFNRLFTQEHQEHLRTYFLVGDPMQSIYRFRGAQVELFGQVQETGLGGQPPEAVAFTRNFRSCNTLVSFVNQVFAERAVYFQEAQAVQDYQGKVLFYAYEGKLDRAAGIAQYVKKHQEQYPNKSIALLVLAKSHLEGLLPALKKAGVAYQAYDLQTLWEVPALQDAYTLLENLWLPQNSLAFWALLRTPWMGCTAAELLAFKSAGITTMAQWLETPLMPHPQKEVLVAWFEAKGRLRLQESFYGVWLALGGYPFEHADSETAFSQFLETVGQMEWHNFSLETLEFKLKNSYVTQGASEVNVLHIMTIHKSKGLEFDTVILPELNSSIPPQPAPLFLAETLVTSEGAQLFVAPCSKPEEGKGLYHYLREKHKNDLIQERERLLYVALTRAKSQLVLWTTSEAYEKPSSHTFLNVLKPHLPEPQSMIKVAMEEQDTPLQMLPSLPLLQPQLTPEFLAERKAALAHRLPENPLSASLINMDNLSHQSRLLGLACHQVLYHIGIGEQNWAALLEGPRWLKWGVTWGATNAEMQALKPKVQAVLAKALATPELRWILHPHAIAHSEWEWVAKDQYGVLHTYIMDRVFFWQDCCWVIDYKLEDPKKHGDFSRAEQYVSQINRYQRLLTQQFSQPVMMAWYFLEEARLEIVGEQKNERTTDYWDFLKSFI